MAVWRLWIAEWDGLDVEVAAELERGGIEGETAEVGPEIELVTRPLTSEALKEIAADVNRETQLFCSVDVVGAERARAAPLRATLDGRLVVEKFQHTADRDPAADSRVVELAHDLRLLILPLLVRRSLLAAFCSARWAR